MDVKDFTHIIKVHASISCPEGNTYACTHTHPCWSSALSMKINRTVLQVWRHFAGARSLVAVSFRNMPELTADFTLHVMCGLFFYLFTFRTQFRWPGTVPWTYSTLYLVFTLHICETEMWKQSRLNKIRLIKDWRTNGFKAELACVCISAYLQAVSCDVCVAHSSRHLLSFENFGWILNA